MGITKTSEVIVEEIRAATAIIKDFPEPPVNFVDITTVLKNPRVNLLAFRAVLNLLDPNSFDVIVSPEARGWLLGQPLALLLGKSFIPVRKPGKLPRQVIKMESVNEYSTVSLEVQLGDIPPGSKVIIIDDTSATQGTTKTIGDIVSTLGSEVTGVTTLYDLKYIDKVALPFPTQSVVPYFEPPAPYMPPAM